MSRVQILTLSPLLRHLFKSAAGLWGYQWWKSYTSSGAFCKFADGSHVASDMGQPTLPQDEVLQVSTVPTWVKDLIDLVFLSCRQLHKWWWWGMLSWESWSIMGFCLSSMSRSLCFFSSLSILCFHHCHSHSDCFQRCFLNIIVFIASS